MRTKLLALSCFALLVAACSSDDNGGSTPTTAAFAQTVNAFVIDTVIERGEDGLDTRVIAEAMVAEYPNLDLVGSAVVADGSNVSIMSNALNDKDVSSAENPLFVSVATMQESGECFGAAVYGYPLPTERFEVTDLPECSAQAVWGALIEELS